MRCLSHMNMCGIQLCFDKVLRLSCSADTSFKVVLTRSVSTGTDGCGWKGMFSMRRAQIKLELCPE